MRTAKYPNSFFEIKRFPTASFRTTVVKLKGEQLYDVSGIMKIKDKQQPQSFETKVVPFGESGHRATATVPVHHTRFGIEYAAKGKPGSENVLQICDGRDFYH